MKLAYTLGIVLFAACAEVDHDEREPGMPPPPPPVGINALGLYELNSVFNLQKAFGEEISTIIEMTDDGNDPGAFFVDMVIANTDGLVQDILEATRDIAIAYLNERLHEQAPDMVDSLLNFGNDLGELTRNFGVTSELAISASQEESGLKGRHEVTGMVFRLDGQGIDVPFASHNMPNIVVQNVGVTVDANMRLYLAPHTIDMPTGRVVRLMVDEVLAGRAVDGADNLQEVMLGLVNCDAIGESLAENPGVFDATTYAVACQAGLVSLADKIYEQLNGWSDAGRFIIRGDAFGTDANQDRTVDSFINGRWNGTVDMGSPTQLEGASFNALRVIQ